MFAVAGVSIRDLGILAILESPDLKQNLSPLDAWAGP
jgi:hypothetical protein